MKVKFGPAGNSDSFYKMGYKRSVEAPQYLSKLGLDAFEYQCGKGITISPDTALQIGAEAQNWNIEMSLHAPYFTNLANPEEERRQKTIDYVLKSAEIVRCLGGKRVIVHSGSLMKNSREVATEIASGALREIYDALDNEGYSDIIVCPELMGVRNQLGTLEEVCALCLVDERLIPCIDYGHYNSRNNGILKTREDFEYIIDYMENKIGKERTKIHHAHFSKIMFDEKSGEKKHLTFEDETYGPDFRLLADILVDRNLTPVIICESDGTQAEDAAYMKAVVEDKLKN